MPIGLADRAHAVAGWFGLLGRDIVFQATAPIIRAGRIAGIPICCWHFVGNREQKLFPHFGEAGTAIFAVKQVEYIGHDRNPRLITTSHSIVFSHFARDTENCAGIRC